MVILMQQVILKSYPIGNPKPDDFSMQESPIPTPANGEILIKTLWLSLDPLIRFALDEKVITGRAHVDLGGVIYGGMVGSVVESKHPDYAVGEIVEGRTGWQEYAAVVPENIPLNKVDPTRGPISTALGILGMPGKTAHACMIEIGRVSAGETVLISAAAGGVGITAGQIGKILGARVIGIAGGKQKCDALLSLGFDAAVDYKSEDFKDQLKQACSEGIDVYIENVGGEITQAVLPLLKHGARMPMCGYIAYYGYGMEGPGPDRLPGFMRMIMSKGLEIKGFGGIFAAGPEALDEMALWMQQGKLKHPETIVNGLENAPKAFCEIFSGNNNIGKLLVKIADPD